MEKKTRSRATGTTTGRKRTRRALTTEELRQKHMQDKNNKITDEDIRNIRIDTNADVRERLDLPEGTERPKDADKDHKQTTPWDVISE